MTNQQPTQEQNCLNCKYRIPASISRKVGDLGIAMINWQKNKRYACINPDVAMVIVFAKGEDYNKGSCECWEVIHGKT